MAATTALDVISMNDALITAQGLHCSPRYPYSSDNASGAGGGRVYKPKSAEQRMTMSDNERTIFNKLGETSSPKGKVRLHFHTSNYYEI